MRELVIDVSRWDANVDFNAWKNKRGLWGVIIKAGGNEGGRYKDSSFETHYRNAKAAGLHIGAYYYTVTTSTSEARKDAEHFGGLLTGKAFDLPVYMDVEDPRQYALSRRALTDVIKTFCDTLNNNGFYSGIYVNGSTWNNNVYSDELLPYADWIAAWGRNWPSYGDDAGLWQQGGMRLSDGDVVYDDVSGYVDCNWCQIDYPTRIKEGYKNNTSPDGTPEQPVVTPQEPGDMELNIDGWAGELTISELQRQLSTYVDGWIDGQDSANEEYMERFSTVRWDESGSPMVRAMQEQIGAYVDGIIGPQTIKKMQEYLNRFDYGLAEDGYFGFNTCCALQRSLNDGKWA